MAGNEKSPAFRFYAADFLADERVAAMTMAERGLYVTLLCHAWREGSIPAEVSELARLVREPVASLRKIWSRVAPCFSAREDGRLVQPRLEEERDKQRRYHLEKAEAGKRGADARWSGKQKDGSAMAEPSKSDGRAIAEPMANDSVGSAIANDGGSFSFSFSRSVVVENSKQQQPCDESQDSRADSAEKSRKSAGNPPENPTIDARSLASWAFDRSVELGVQVAQAPRETAIEADITAAERLLLSAPESIIRERWERVLDDLVVGHLQRKDDVSLRFLLRLWPSIEAHEKRQGAALKSKNGRMEREPEFDYNALLGLKGGPL